MQLKELDRYFNAFFSIEEYKQTDSAYNGLQVSSGKQAINKIAFAVDACMETFKRAVEMAADLLFVHHGLFWGQPIPLKDVHYSRVKYLLSHDLALYAVHLPLDSHERYGNNAGISAMLKLNNIEPFGLYKGKKIGFKGAMPKPKTMDDILEMLDLRKEECQGVLPFGPDKIDTVGIISGGAAREVEQAMQEELDIFITGEMSHQIYHQCLEGGINLIAGGHYKTEICGVKLLSEKVATDLGLETIFIDVPTGF